MRNKMNENVQRIINFRSMVITCSHCGKSETRNHPGGRPGYGSLGGYTDVQRMYTDGERYYGSPLTSRMGSIIVDGDSCASCVRNQAQGKVNCLSVMSSPRNYDRNPLRVNEMP
jgi:hypothetical protein